LYKAAASNANRIYIFQDSTIVKVNNNELDSLSTIKYVHDF